MYNEIRQKGVTLFDGEKALYPASLEEIHVLAKESMSALDVYFDGKYLGTYFPNEQTQMINFSLN